MKTEVSEVYLKVPYEEKDKAKALGAKWNGKCKRWYCPLVSKLFNLSQHWDVYLNVPDDEQDEARIKGARYGESGWYVVAGTGLTDFRKWLPNEYKCDFTDTSSPLTSQESADEIRFHYDLPTNYLIASGTRAIVPHFCTTVLISLYGKPPGSLEDTLDLSLLEKRLRADDLWGFLPVAHLLMAYMSGETNLKFCCTITLDSKGSTSPSDATLRVRMTPPKPDKSTNILFEKFGCHRFMTAIVSGFHKNKNEERRVEEHMVEHGFELVGRKYMFLGGEEVPHKQRKEGATTTLSLWFFAVSGPGLAPFHVQDVYDSLGDFEGQPDIKLNARLKLGFSSTIRCGTVCRDKVMKWDDDIRGSGDGVLTDGCGLIGAELAARIPYGVHSGVQTSDRSDRDNLPAIIQVRLVTHFGLVKGCLLVTSDQMLCPKDALRIRPSMLKSKPPPSMSDHDEVILLVNNTFESPEYVDKSNSFDPRFDCFAHLNQQCCLILRHLGVPQEFFTNLLHEDIMRITEATNNAEAAFRLVRRKLTRSFSPMHSAPDNQTLSASSDDSDVDGNHDNDKDDSQHNFLESDESQLRNVIKLCAERASHFFYSGFVQKTEASQEYEPMLEKLIRKLQLHELRALKKCNIRLRQSLYFVGAPDPYDVLNEGEVFVCLPRDGRKGDVQCLNTSVAVFRNPLHHPGDIRVLSAVDNPQLKEKFSRTNGRVIVFSVKGDRSEADKMSGGDYDGDEYMVIWNALVELVAVQEPYTKKSNAFVPSSVLSNRVNLVTPESGIEKDPFQDIVRSAGGSSSVGTPLQRKAKSIGMNILSELIGIAQLSLVGRYTNAWFAWADKDLVCVEANECHEIVLAALDAQKTGQSVLENKALLHAKKPHYRITSSSLPPSLPLERSTSILGILFDQVTCAHDAVARLPASSVKAVLDEDIEQMYNDRGGILPIEFWGNVEEDWKLKLKVYKDHFKTKSLRSFEEVNRLYKYYEDAFENSVVEALEYLLNLEDQEQQQRPTFPLMSSYKKSFLQKSIRRCLASVVYKITYDAAWRSCATQELPVTFCWGVCGKDLHEIKRECDEDPYATYTYWLSKS